MTTAAPEKGTLVVLPEMFATGFTMNADAMAEPYGGKTEQFLSNLASKWAVHVIAGAAMRGGNGQVRNKALVFSPDGKLAGFYAKMRPFTPGGEAEYYAAGTGPLVLALGDCTVSPFVCYDLRFPELFRQAAGTRQPELFVVIASWPDKRILHWQRLLQARAIENQAYVLGVNRIGNDPFYHYPGRSMLADFNGDILSDAGEQEGWLTARLDLGLLRQYRHGLPFLKDLKPVKIGAAGE
jgi:predicted amidohydrolase